MNNPVKSLSSLLNHLDTSNIPFPDFGCFVALSANRKAIFACPMQADGSPERDGGDPRHLNWIEVTAPEPEFVEAVNQHFGTAFRWVDFAGR